MTHNNLGHRMHKLQRTRNGKKPETIPAWQLDNIKSKKEDILEAQRGKKESPLCYIEGHTPPHKRGVRIKITNILQ